MNMNMNKRFLIALLVLGVVFSVGTSLAFGQAVYGSIFGTVTDPSGAAVGNAKVIVTSASKATSVEAISNDSGNYSVTHLIPDTYNVRIEGAGFKGLENKGITVSADTSVKVDGKFEVGGTTETVEVTAEAPQLKTDRADVATIFNDKAVEDLPLFNRNFTALVLASPGAQQLGWSHASSENPQGSLQTKVNGQTFAGTGFMLDGTDNRDPILGIIVINPTLESVTEAKMTSQNYDAEFGQAIAGVVASQEPTRCTAALSDSAAAMLPRHATRSARLRARRIQLLAGQFRLRFMPSMGLRLAAPSLRTSCSSSATTRRLARRLDLHSCKLFHRHW
jgi:hypothetical protein